MEELKKTNTAKTVSLGSSNGVIGGSNEAVVANNKAMGDGRAMSTGKTMNDGKAVMSKEPSGGARRKLTYEQLNDACNQLWQQNRQLMTRNRELEQFMMNKRLEYLFKVVELNNRFSSDFVVSCANEIEEALTIPQKGEEGNQEGD